MVGKKRRNIAIMGAAGRDYHNFLVKYKDDSRYDVKFFTATQIPGIANRKFPKKLAGKLYKKDVPIFPEEQLKEKIKNYKIDEVVFGYSDVSHENVMNKASSVLACGADFVLLGGNETMITSKKPVISVCAVRTGSGKSQTSRKVADLLKKHGKRVVAIRHPMPYGDLWKQRCQRFASYADFDKHECTIEEREEYEPWIEKGMVIYAGVDYKDILKHAEREADVIVWDGGNNDLPFYKPDLHIVVADPHRAGHELRYHPGEANFKMADVIVINKVDTAPKEGVTKIIENIKKFNAKAIVIKAESKLLLKNGIKMKGVRAIVVEDGPTLTHGEMSFGAGFIAAKRHGAIIVSPKKYAIGSIKETYKKYQQVKDVLPAMGYGKKQIHELEQTINSAKAQIVIDGTPVCLSKLIDIKKPIVEVSYYLKEKGLGLEKVLKNRGYI